MEHTTITHRPALRRPILIVAFEGWNDAGEAASTALGFVASTLGARSFAHVDPEEFYDFQVVRPTVHRDEGRRRRIEWPQVEFLSVRLPQEEHDLILVRGHEPNLRWRAFTREILEVARDLNVELLVTLGALLADVPHTRPVQVVGSAVDPELAERLSLATNRYEGPTGILGVLGDAAQAAGLPALSLWAALPHYVQASPNPRAALALVDRLRRLLTLPLDTRSLVEATEAFDATVADIVSDDPELAGYVERLEAEADSDEEDDSDEDDEEETGPTLADLSPDQFVADLERFLRDQPGGRT